MVEIKEAEAGSNIPTSDMTFDQLAETVKNARKLEEAGQFEEAISLYRKVLDVIPNDIDAMFHQGNSLFQVGKYEEALSCYDRLIENDPTHIGALKAQKITLDQLGMHFGISPVRRKQLL